MNLATFDASRVRLHTGLHKPAHDRDSRPRARPATIADGRPGSALAQALGSANRRHVGPTCRDVGVYASTHTESATMPPWAGIL
ncbi:MAG: hypothetical protein IBJ18_07295 [Phycisphaerales bacterium]|nr:hypothetical protein [Phycisphaerales bacterium]